VSDKNVFARIVEASLTQESASEATGGNAALMANKLATQNCKVLLGGPVGARLKRLLHNDIQLASTKLADIDEVHLILEYKAGSSWVC
jgi:predicted Fe-Mo cluster-binding NifX family protein